MKPKLVRYKLILAAATPILFAYTLYRAFKDGGLRYFAQRFGYALPDNPGTLWIHCASVGEVNTAIPLLQRLLASQPAPLMVSTSTPTGAKVLSNALGKAVTHVYLPLDYTSLTRRFLKKLQPRALLIAETELWPVTICTSSEAGIPVLLFNARLTERTLRSPKWLAAAYASAIAELRCILAKSPQDAERFRTLGASFEQVEVIGSLKLARKHTAAPAAMNIPTPYWLAASTHDDEELRIAKAWLNTKQDALLVIAPRHPERRDHIIRALGKAGIESSLRSQHPQPPPDCRVHIADTLGELPALIQNAKCVFMGGSLIERGGHNIIEPAQLGKPVLSGPDLSNFAEERRLLEKAGGLIVVHDETELAKAVSGLLEEPEKARELGERNRAACRDAAGVDERYLKRILDCLESASS